MIDFSSERGWEEFVVFSRFCNEVKGKVTSSPIHDAIKAYRWHRNFMPHIFLSFLQMIRHLVSPSVNFKTDKIYDVGNDMWKDHDHNNEKLFSCANSTSHDIVSIKSYKELDNPDNFLRYIRYNNASNIFMPSHAISCNNRYPFVHRLHTESFSQ
jgi:hypothetical protein